MDALITQCEEAIDDDLNTPVLISHLFDGVRMINSLVAGNEKIDAGNLAKLKKLYQDYVFDILGLKAESESVSQDWSIFYQFPFISLFGILNGDSGCFQFVPDLVGSGPVFLLLGFCTDRHPKKKKLLWLQNFRKTR